MSRHTSSAQSNSVNARESYNKHMNFTERNLAKTFYKNLRNASEIKISSVVERHIQKRGS
jgi:hypothetical protein